MVIPYSIEDLYFDDPVQMKGKPEKTWRVLCAGLICENKNQVAVARAVERLRKEGMDIQLTCIGEVKSPQIKKKLEQYPFVTVEPFMKKEALKQKYLNATDTKDIIFYGYLYQEKKTFALDYNDLIKFSLYIFASFPEIREKWQARLEYIMIDEFQDIDQLQYELMEVLCGYHKNLFVVGDPDQTIYTWRGADVKYLLDFDRNFPGTQTIMMMDNYRSTPEILAAANALIDKNRNRIKKSLRPRLPSGGPVRCYHAQTQESEAKHIADAIAALHDKGTPWGDCAVLYRAHYVTRALEAALQDAEIPFTIYSGVQFYDRTEVKDALSYLRMAVSQDDLSFLRIVSPLPPSTAARSTPPCAGLWTTRSSAAQKRRALLRLSSAFPP